MRSFPFAALLAGGLLLASVGAHAQDQSAIARARELGKQAGTAFEQGHWEEARALFHEARTLYPAPTLGVREARCLVKLGRLKEAKLIYERMAALPADEKNADVETFKRAQADANLELGVLKGRLPYLTVRVEGGTRVALTLDGVAMPPTTIGMEQEADPGLHTVAGTIDEKAIDPLPVTLAEAEHRAIVAKPAGAAVMATTPTTATTLTTKDEEIPTDDPPPASKNVASPPSPGKTQRILGFTAIGAGVVGVGVGIGLGLAAGSKHSTLVSACTNGVCPPDQQSNLDSFNSLTVGSTVAYVIGGVFAAGGVVLVLTAPKSAARATTTTTGRIVPLIGLGTVGLRGDF